MDKLFFSFLSSNEQKWKETAKRVLVPYVCSLPFGHGKDENNYRSMTWNAQSCCRCRDEATVQFVRCWFSCFLFYFKHIYFIFIRKECNSLMDDPSESFLNFVPFHAAIWFLNLLLDGVLADDSSLSHEFWNWWEFFFRWGPTPFWSRAHCTFKDSAGLSPTKWFHVNAPSILSSHNFFYSF